MNKTTINSVKFNEVCAILYGVIWVAALVVNVAATPFGAPDDLGRFLLEVNADRTADLVGDWLRVISGTVGLPVALGIYQALRRWGDLLWIALLALVMGGLFSWPPTFWI